LAVVRVGISVGDASARLVRSGSGWSSGQWYGSAGTACRRGIAWQYCRCAVELGHWGGYFLHFKDRSWFPLKDVTNTRAQTWFARFGIWSLLLSWLPVIGDPLTLIAGIMRVPIGRFVLFVAIGKVLRYAIIVVVVQNWPA